MRAIQDVLSRVFYRASQLDNVIRGTGLNPGMITLDCSAEILHVKWWWCQTLRYFSLNLLATNHVSAWLLIVKNVLAI